MASMREIADMLLSLIDNPEDAVQAEMGVDDMEYLGQGINRITVNRDTLLRMAGRQS